MGLLFVGDRRGETGAEVALPTVDFAAALDSFSHKEPFHLMCAKSGLQPADGEQFVREVLAAYHALMSSIKSDAVKSRADMGRIVSSVVSPGFPVDLFLQLLAKNAGGGRELPAKEVISIAKAEAI